MASALWASNKGTILINPSTPAWTNPIDGLSRTGIGIYSLSSSAVAMPILLVTNDDAIHTPFMIEYNRGLYMTYTTQRKRITGSVPTIDGGIAFCRVDEQLFHLN